MLSRRTLVLAFAAFCLGAPALAQAAAKKPADVFQGRIILAQKPFPASFSSDGAFVSYMKKADLKAFTFGESGKIPIEFMAFFARPVNVTQLQATLYDITETREMKDTFPIYPGQKDTRILASFMELDASLYEPERKYHLVITPGYGGQVLAETIFVIKAK